MEKTKKTYWDTFESPYQMGHQKHRDYLLNLFRFKNIKNLLDVGCGTGPIYQLLKEAQDNIKYKGTDYSWAMIDVAKREFPEADFEVQDARKLIEDDNSWDCVLLMHCLDHLDNYQAAIAEAARVTSKYVCIVLWRAFVDEGTRLNPRNMYGKSEGEDPWEDTFLQEYSKETLETEFKKNGLEIEQIAEGPEVNEENKYNFVYWLRKI